MAIAVRPWPDDASTAGHNIGGEDAGEDLVIRYAADGAPWMWEIEHASRHPEHIAAALDELRRRSGAHQPLEQIGEADPLERQFVRVKRVVHDHSRRFDGDLAFAGTRFRRVC